jgi:glycerophosphoryl diester phosphodiesterase
MDRKHYYFILFLIYVVSFNLFASDSPLIIGHRGASGYRPEHTLASYELAIAMGADYIEPDLVMTKDGVLMARHENEISETTDVQTKFPDRKMTKEIDGMKITGWFIEDFTLKEMKTLKARERLAFRNHSYDGKFEVPTFKEILDLIKKEKRKIGIYPETKHPTYFQSISLPLEETLIKELAAYGLNNKNSPVFIQSFEITSLEKLKKLTSLSLIYLIDENTTKSLKEISTIANGIGPNKRLIIPINQKGELGDPTKLIKEAHELGLKVFPYTFRDEAFFLHKDYKGDPEKEYLQFFELGVDGIFSDFPDRAILARKKFLQKNNIKNNTMKK